MVIRSHDPISPCREHRPLPVSHLSLTDRGVVDGNTADVTTHIDTWDHLVALTGNVDWLYVADSKLATFDNVAHIHTRGGRFLSVLPASRREDRSFRDWVVTNSPEWSFAQTVPSRQPDTPDDILSTYQDHLPSADGHRIVWVHSTSKARRDATRRHARIAKAIAQVDALNVRLASPRCRIKTAVADDAASDGMWPLLTNDTSMSPAELLAAYKWQPNLEKRHAQLKGTQLVAPMWLRDPARIEGLLTCHFIAMLIAALIERTIRRAMTAQGMTELSLYPEDRGCAAPTTARILEIFTSVARHHLAAPDGTVLRTFHPELTDLQRQVLDLLDIPTSVYNPGP